MKFIKLCIFIIFLSLTVFTQFSQSTNQNDKIKGCMAKHFPPILTILSLNIDAEPKIKICNEPSREMCSVLYGISQNNYEGVKCLVNAGYNFNVESRKYEQKHIPLMNATNDDEMLKLILKSEIDVKVKDKYSKTLFQDRISAIPFLKKFISRRKNHSFKRIYKSVDLLLENGTDPNEMFNGMTPLMYQAKGYGHGRYFSLLLKYQANPNLQSVGKGETALMMVGDDAEKIEMLLDANADIYIQDFKGMTAIFHAIKRCQINKIKALMKKDENILESLDGNGKTALKYLRKQSRKKDCKKLKEFLVK